MSKPKRNTASKRTSNAIYNVLVWGNELRNEEVHLARARKHMLNENYELAYDEAYRAIMFNPHSEAAQELMFQSTKKSIERSAELRRANAMGNYRYEGRCCRTERVVEHNFEEEFTSKTSYVSDSIVSQPSNIQQKISVSTYSEDESIDSVISKTPRPSNASGRPSGNEGVPGRSKQMDPPSSQTVHSVPASFHAVVTSTPRASTDSNAPRRSAQSNRVSIRSVRGSIQTDGDHQFTDSAQSTSVSSRAAIDFDAGSSQSRPGSTRSKTSSMHSMASGSHHVRLSVSRSDVIAQGSVSSFDTDTVTEASIISKNSERSGASQRNSIN